MPIHPSRFSSRKKGSQKSKFLVKIAGFILLLGLAAALVLGLRVGISLLGSLENIPNEKTYPISTNSKERTNLLLVSMKGSEPKLLSLVSISGGDPVKFLPIDLDTSVILPGGKGSFSLLGVWNLGNLDGGEGINVLRDSVSRALALPIDGYLAIPEESQEKLARDWGTVPKEVMGTLSSFSFWQKLFDLGSQPKIYGSYEWRDLIGLAFQARVVEVKEFSLKGYLSPGNLAGEEVQNLNASSFDQNLAPEFFEASINRAHPKVSIINSSGIAGAGAHLARYAHNLGGEVISVESGRLIKESQITDHTGGSALPPRLTPLIGGKVSIDNESRRADIEIVIGQSAQGRF
jgi:hypothetical protein